MYGLKVEEHFDGAHFLTDYHGTCENLHGHRWRVVVSIETKKLQGAKSSGGDRPDATMRDMVLDFGVFKHEGSLKPATIAALEGEGFTLSILPFRTTAENLARWFFDQLKERGLPVSQVEVDETPNNRAFYAPKGHVGR